MTNRHNTIQDTDLSDTDDIDCGGLTVPSMSPKLIAGVIESDGRLLDTAIGQDMVCHAGRSTFRRSRLSSIEKPTNIFTFEDYSLDDLPDDKIIGRNVSVKAPRLIFKASRLSIKTPRTI